MLKIGHRGACATAPENTLESFRKAIALGADGVELDVHLCKSGEPVVIHDGNVDRTTNGKGAVAGLTLAEIRALEVTGGGHVPTLRQVLQEREDMYYFIEIKAAEAALPSAAIVQRLIEQGRDKEKLCIISFNHEALRSIREAFPKISLGASFEALPEGFAEYAAALGAHAVLPEYYGLSPHHVEQAHRAGLSIFPWTVNAPADIARLKAMGVDGIISDYPDRL